MSGGGRILIESIKRWQNKVEKIEVFTCQAGKAMLDHNIEDQGGIEMDVLRIPKCFFKSLFLLFLYKTLIGSILIVKRTFNSDKNTIIFSQADIFPDLIPGFLAKLFNRKIRWVASFYFFASSPFSKNFPYKGFSAVARGSIYYFTQKLCYLLIRKFSDFVIVCNEIDTKRFVKDNYPENKLYAIYGGVDLKEANSIPEPKIKIFDAVFMARLHPQKGPVEAVKAWSEVVKKNGNAKLAMIGNGPELDKLKKLIQELGLEKNISLLGFVDGHKKYKVLKSAKIFIHSSIYETGGMAAAEGMAAGLPVVAFDHEGFDYCYPKGMVRVASVGDCKKMAQTILGLLDNPDVYQKIRNEACEFAKVWDWDHKSQLLFEKVING